MVAMRIAALAFLFSFVNAHITDAKSKILVNKSQARSGHSSNTTLRRGWAETIVDRNLPEEKLLEFLSAKLKFWDEHIAFNLKKLARYFGLDIPPDAKFLEKHIIDLSK